MYTHIQMYIFIYICMYTCTYERPLRMNLIKRSKEYQNVCTYIYLYMNEYMKVYICIHIYSIV